MYDHPHKCAVQEQKPLDRSGLSIVAMCRWSLMGVFCGFMRSHVAETSGNFVEISSHLGVVYQVFRGFFVIFRFVNGFLCVFLSVF
jgi:hypothetical protein